MLDSTDELKFTEVTPTQFSVGFKKRCLKMSKYRKKMSKKLSRKSFRKKTGVHKKNFATPMRGGIRM